MDFRSQISNFKFQISEFRFRISEFRFQISDFRFRNSEFGFRILVRMVFSRFRNRLRPEARSGFRQASRHSAQNQHQHENAPGLAGSRTSPAKGHDHSKPGRGRPCESNMAIPFQDVAGNFPAGISSGSRRAGGAKRRSGGIPSRRGRYGAHCRGSQKNRRREEDAVCHPLSIRIRRQ